MTLVTFFILYRYWFVLKLASERIGERNKAVPCDVRLKAKRTMFAMSDNNINKAHSTANLLF